MRRIERAKQLPQAGGDFSRAQVGASAGFSDQSAFSHQFMHTINVTPGQVRSPARIARKAASFSKKTESDPPYHSP
jgi:AraC-like DNA-binding protein